MNPDGMNGLFYHNPGSFLIQLKGVLITAIYSFVVSVVLLKLVDMFVGLRTTEHEERVGLDLIEHRESAYTLID